MVKRAAGVANEFLDANVRVVVIQNDEEDCGLNVGSCVVCLHSALSMKKILLSTVLLVVLVVVVVCLGGALTKASLSSGAGTVSAFFLSGSRGSDEISVLETPQVVVVVVGHGVTVAKVWDTVEEETDLLVILVQS